MKQVEAYTVQRNIGGSNKDVLVTVKRTTANIDGVRKSCYRLERRDWGYDVMIVSTRGLVQKALQII